jgi:hypothetical protein
MPTPNAASLSMTGYAPTRRVDTRIAPGETSLAFGGYVPLVAVNTKSLIVNLPSMLATFTERRRLIRATTDELRDLVFQGRDTELYVAFELNGEVFDAANLTGVELVYEDTDGNDGMVTQAAYPAVFDMSTRANVRGKTVNILRLVLDDAFIAELFDVGLWTVEVFGFDADHPGGALWGAMEWEVRTLFDGVAIVPNTGSLAFTERAPTVRYDRALPITGALTFTGDQPDVYLRFAGIPSAGAMAFTGYRPVLSPVTVPTGTLTMTGAAPAIS